MTPEAQRIAIAEACGYRRKEPNWNRWLKPDGQYEAYGIAGLPNYLSDLNAMHEAEKILTTDEQRISFMQNLRNVTSGHAKNFDYYNIVEVWNMLSATAPQRAEAFLRTLGKWVAE
jgi:hypothetical protein